MSKISQLCAPPASEAEGCDTVLVLIAIPTYRRPLLLNQLLRGIAEISKPHGCAVEVLVMDNDSVPSAHDLVARTAEDFPFPLSYEHVSEPGLSSVRNFGLKRAQHFDFLAMIDDDEIPQRQWLVELLNVQAATAADAVIGPVPSVLPDVTPRWLRDGHFFDYRRTYPDRTTIREGYTGNCLLRVTSIERLNIAFEKRLNFAGGEDLLFFRQIVARGGKLAYAARAVAEESVGTERATASYIVRLHFRHGNTLSLSERYMSGRTMAKAARALKAGGLVARGCLTLIPYTVFRGRTGFVVALCDVARGLGAFAGLIGRIYEPYERASGASD